METIEPPKAPSRAERSRQILAVLAKHGFAAAGAGLTHRDDADRKQSQAEQARMACEELGPTFIKLGQVLSTRADLLPPEYRDELAKLQDDVPALDTAIIESIIEDELGEAPAGLFARFDSTPLACASIGQVHSAELTDGTAVVVKVRKPEIRGLIERDLEILGKLVASSEKHFPGLEDYEPAGMLEEFADQLRAELDYGREARNIEQFAAIFEADKGIELPEVIWEYTTARILTMTRVDGHKISALPALTTRRGETASARVARFVLEPALINGIFHADPHPGIILIRKDGSIGVVDFGMVGHIPEEMRRQLIDLFLALEHHDATRLVDRLCQLAPPIRPLDRGSLVQRVSRLLDRYMSESLERVQIGAALEEMLEIVRAYGLRPPATVAMLFKAIANSEEIVMATTPGKTLTEFFAPIAGRAAASRFSPEDLAHRVQTSALHVAELSNGLPQRADRVLADVERGNLRVWARFEELEPTLRRLERMVERANAAMIAAACIVGITILLAVYHPQGWRAAIAWLFWIAIAIAAAIVFRTALATLRNRK
jgi:ubiquinone biosynthesis protein